MARTKVEVDAITGKQIERPYTDEENAQADTDEQVAAKETPTDEVPASDDAGAPSTDAG